jgi:hypothetical protein
MDAKYAKLKVLKLKYDFVTSNVMSVLNAIKKEKPWVWALGSIQEKRLEDLKADLAEQVSTSAFWKSWAIDPEFTAVSKKNLGAKELADQFKLTTEMERLILQLEKQLLKTQRIHKEECKD